MVESPPVSYLVPPTTTRLSLTGGDTLTVKQQLTAGDTLDLFDRAGDVSKGVAGLSPIKVGVGLVLAYVVDWSLVDPQGRLLPWRDAGLPERETMLRGLTFEKFSELLAVVTQHDTAIRQEKKRTAAGGIAS
jgi:hypothetical protein